MKVVGIIVEHREFGIGEIIEYIPAFSGSLNGYIKIRFFACQSTKNFLFPDVFEKFLTTQDNEINSFLQMKREKKLKEETVIQENIKKEQERQAEIKQKEEQLAREIIQKRKEKEEKIRYEKELKEQEDKQKRTQLLEMLESFGFEGFLHTTNFDNFIKIYTTNEIKSRLQLEKENIKFSDNANKEIIDTTLPFIKNKVRCYYRSKTPTNYGAALEFEQDRPVILVLDKQLIYDKEAFFTNMNAASSLSCRTKNIETALEFNWEEIFKKGPHSSLDYMAKKYRNAEFLLPSPVSMLKVEKIIFKFNEDKDKAIEEFGKDIRFEHNPNMFF